ncbi:MAG TPA: FHA domain-containing protein [Casimicrobiaceae bacterium]|nr:FHA domain-containing protein [Casimicrobiaceae bacterium]
MAKLVLHIPGGGTRDIKLDLGRLTIGRRADNDVCLPYPAVSAEHAAIVTVLDDSFLEDLQSTNGTLVNGKRVVKHFLRDRDTIDVGRVQLVYVVNESETIAAAEEEAKGSEASLAPDIRGGSANDVEAEDGDEIVGQQDTEGFGNRDYVLIDESDEDAAAAGAVPHTRVVDNLLSDLMETNLGAMVAVEIPPAVSAVPATSRTEAIEDDIARGVYVEVLNGPNAGQIVPMTRRRFVLGKAGATVAEIRRDENRFSLVPIDIEAMSLVNEEPVPDCGVLLEFGDSIEVAGVKLRFGRRTPL